MFREAGLSSSPEHPDPGVWWAGLHRFGLARCLIAGLAWWLAHTVCELVVRGERGEMMISKDGHGEVRR